MCNNVGKKWHLDWNIPWVWKKINSYMEQRRIYSQITMRSRGQRSGRVTSPSFFFPQPSYQVYKISRNTKTSLNGRKKIYSKYLEKHNKHVRVLWDHKFPTFVTQYMFRNQNIKNTKYIIMIAECFISDHYHLLRKSACIYLKQVSYLWKDRHHFYIFSLAI